MNPWREVVGRIEDGTLDELVAFLHSLSDLGRRAVAVQLPGYVAEVRREGVEGRWWLQDRAARLRAAGAACLSGAAQVADWLDRQDLRQVRDPRTDAVRLMSLLSRRTGEWRADLAVRLVEGLRPVRRRRFDERVPNWELAAALVEATGVEPPDNDAFAEGWAWRLATAVWMTQDPPPPHDVVVPRLFQAAGVAAALNWSETRNHGVSAAARLADMAGDGLVKRQTLVDGCAGRFMAGGAADEVAPFMTLWSRLAVDVTEIPVLDFVRVLPSASPALAGLLAGELRRADEAGLVDDELFGEAVGALAFRREKKNVAAALSWIGARTTPARAPAALHALSTVFTEESPALRDRAVRLAIALATTLATTLAATLAPLALTRPAGPGPAPKTGQDTDEADGTRPAGRCGQDVDGTRLAGRKGQDVAEAVEAVREAAGGLPGPWRERLGAVIGPIPAPEQATPVPPALVPATLPPLPAPITTPWELAHELGAMSRQVELQQAERILAALVTLAHRDRDALADALRPWHRALAEEHPHLPAGLGVESRARLVRCALAVVAPGHEGVPEDELDRLARDYPHPLQRFVARRLDEVLKLLESGGSVPVLLATPTEPTGHLDPVTLLERMELLGAEPLDADFHQALLRLPRRVDPALAGRADRLGSAAGRTLADWLRGGAPDPEVTCRVRETPLPHGFAHVETDCRITPPRDVPPPIAELWTAYDGPRYLTYPHTMAWWPALMPSHREVVAAHVTHFLYQGVIRRSGETALAAAIAHGDGPTGDAVAAVVAAGLGHHHAERRGHAVEAVLTLAARGDLPAAALGRLMARFVAAGAAKLGALTRSLEHAANAGAYTEVWDVLAEAVPALLPAPGERPRAGLAGLLAVAAETAAYARTAGPLPPLAPAGGRPGAAPLAELAARKGGSRVVEEAGRLLTLVRDPD
ncbi:hypothetical protein ACQEUU_22830 [Nonomuraea sp. CA-218870]|uniref:hypothetical protein n=1 Tax=Nonomuraea sp. CA-218870 TaxID=3239998 RepID=UPI003D8ED037